MKGYGGKERKAFLSAVLKKNRESRNLLCSRRACCDVEKREKRSYFEKETQTLPENERGKQKSKQFSLAK